MTKSLIVVVLAWTCQVALGSEIKILEAQVQGKSWMLGPYMKAKPLNVFCFEKKLFVATFAAKNLHRVAPIMGNTSKGLGQQECPTKEFQLLDGISLKEMKTALGRRTVVNKTQGNFTLCVSDVVFYHFQYAGDLIQAFEAGRAVACPTSQASRN